MTDGWRNSVCYDGWILAVNYRGKMIHPVGSKLHTYDMRVGFSDEEAITVRAFRAVKSERLVKGAAVRVTGRLIFMDDGGRCEMKVEAKRVEVIER